MFNRLLELTIFPDKPLDTPSPKHVKRAIDSVRRSERYDESNPIAHTIAAFRKRTISPYIYGVSSPAWQINVLERVTLNYECLRARAARLAGLRRRTAVGLQDLLTAPAG